MTDLLSKYGSFRRLIEAYWLGQLDPKQEREIEDGAPKEILASFKPVIVEAMPATEWAATNKAPQARLGPMRPAFTRCDCP